jgi:hypothetical protein
VEQGSGFRFLVLALLGGRGLGVACWRISVPAVRFLEIIVRGDLGHGVLPSVCRLVAVFGLHVWGEEAVASPLGSSLLQSSFWSGFPVLLFNFLSIRRFFCSGRGNLPCNSTVLVPKNCAAAPLK